MGFAGVLRELKPPRGELVPGLVSFNVGSSLRPICSASVLIAATGTFWTLQRVVGF